MRNFFEHPLIKIFFSVLFTFLFIFFFVWLTILLLSNNIGKNIANSSNECIGVVEVKGIIGSSKKILEQLKKYKEDGNIKAIVIQINSPGGSVVPSQEIYREILKIKKIKPVYAYMQSLAASGGYYIAVACNKIMANPGTITGSIGVILELTNFEKLFDKIGIKNIVIKSGKFKDTGNPFRPMTDEEKEWLNNVVANIYNQFLNAVSLNRNIPIKQLKKIADGRIFTGQQALQYKLIDTIGNFSDLISLIEKNVKFKTKPEIIYPEEKKNIIEKIIDSSAKLIINGFQKSNFNLRYQ